LRFISISKSGQDPGEKKPLSAPAAGETQREAGTRLSGAAQIFGRYKIWSGADGFSIDIHFGSIVA
jgi:hypothetical protein